MAKKLSDNYQNARSQTLATWAASIIAGIALTVSMFSLYESHESRVAMVRDDLLIRARRPMGDQQLLVLKSNDKLHIGCIAAPWELLISNTGSSTVSITAYEVFQVSPGNGQIFYSGLDRGLFSPEDNRPVTLPISLDAGRSLRLIAAVGLTPGVKAYTVITDALSGDKPMQSVSSIEKVLAAKGIDIYDNTVIPLVSQGEVIGWRVEQQGKEQTFLFKLYTARGSEASEVSSWYDLKRY